MLQEHRGGSGAEEERSGWERLTGVLRAAREAESKPGGRAHAKAPGQEASWLYHGHFCGSQWSGFPAPPLGIPHRGGEERGTPD